MEFLNKVTNHTFSLTQYGVIVGLFFLAALIAPVFAGDPLDNLSCYDSDGGKNFYAKGAVVLDDGNAYQDFCYEGLTEFYCDNGGVTSSWNECTCENGRCIDEVKKLSDDDKTINDKLIIDNGLSLHPCICEDNECVKVELAEDMCTVSNTFCATIGGKEVMVSTSFDKIDKTPFTPITGMSIKNPTGKVTDESPSESEPNGLSDEEKARINEDAKDGFKDILWIVLAGLGGGVCVLAFFVIRRHLKCRKEFKGANKKGQMMSPIPMIPASQIPVSGPQVLPQQPIEDIEPIDIPDEEEIPIPEPEETDTQSQPQISQEQYDIVKKQILQEMLSKLRGQ